MKYIYGFIVILSGVDLLFSMGECNLDATLGWACAFFLSISCFATTMLHFNKKGQ
jgi:hypothetical protein